MYRVFSEKSASPASIGSESGRPRSGALVEASHRALQPVGDDRLNRFGGALDRIVEVCARLGSHAFEQVILALALARWTADANSHANEIGRSERLLYRSHAAIAGVAAALLE